MVYGNQARRHVAGAPPSTTPVREAMTPNIVYGFEDQDVQEAVRIMEEYQIRRLPILNRQKRLGGRVIERSGGAYRGPAAGLRGARAGLGAHRISAVTAWQA
jgi:CBS domain-containing protein